MRDYANPNLPRSSTLFIVVSCVLGLLIAGCGGGNLTQTTKLAPATITSISPTTVPEGSAAFTLQVMEQVSFPAALSRSMESTCRQHL